MMDMMNSTGMVYGYTFLWMLHVLAVVTFAVGFLFLVYLATKRLTERQLKTWGIALVVIGTVVCLLTIGAKGGPWNDSFGDDRPGIGSMMHDMMMDDDDHMGMSMDDMSEVLEGKTGDAFDKAFIEMMIPHHQGAIDMARLAQQNAGHQEIKKMADDIISAQQSEIDMMQQWLQDWGYTE